MLKIDRTTKTVMRLEEPTLAASELLERQHLQEFIFNSPEDFFAELGLALFVLGKEVPSKTVQDRIDLLALDKDGNSIIIELKRGNDRLQLIQAIAYAGMVAKWTSADFLALCGERADSLSEFLDVESDEINSTQRILLIAEAYDYEVLVASEWLSERYQVDITCSRVAVARDKETGAEYLTCTHVFPAPELSQVARSRRAPGGTPAWSNWEEALAAVDNRAIVNYFREQLALMRECNLRKRALRYQVKGIRRFSLQARRDLAYAFQIGRFEGDIAFWQSGIREKDEVKVVQTGARLRLLVSTGDDLRFFHQSATATLANVQWLDTYSACEIELAAEAASA